MKRIVVLCKDEEYDFIRERAGKVPLSRWLKGLAIPDEIQPQIEGTEPRSKTIARTCEHGTGAGFRCWKCGGLARIKAPAPNTKDRR